ncbi:MAG: hypothetical protein HQ582_14620 [Planctomycetes bacterium]|nr:hypothetical protein [Planctomycetota bacterium]
MPSRKTLVVLIPLASIAMAAIFYLRWADASRNIPTVPPGPFAMASEAEAAPAPLETPADAPSSSVPDLNTGPSTVLVPEPAAPSSPAPVAKARPSNVPAPAAPDPFPQPPGMKPPQRGRPSGTTSKAKDAKEGLQSITYRVGNTSAETAIQILRIAAPDAQFTYGEGAKRLAVTATPADHEKIHALVMELGSSLAEAPALDAKEPTYGGPRTTDPMLSGGDPFAAAPAAGDPLAAVPAASDPFAATPAASGPASVPKDAKDVMEIAVFATGDLDAQALMQVFEAAVPEAVLSVGDDGKSLVVSGPPAEFAKVKNALDKLLRGPDDLQVTFSGPRPTYPSANVVPLQGSTTPQYAIQPRVGWTRPSTATRREPADPEMAKLEQSDANASKEVAEIVEECKTATGEEQQTKVRWKLKQAVLVHFAVRQSKREREVARLEARLEKVRQSITKRSELQDQIVDRHVSQLLGEADDLEF